MNHLQNYIQFHCPEWEELPQEGIRIGEAIELIQEFLSPIALEENIITPTMVQNYRKWGIMPKMEGRKYRREDLSVLIAITIYKQVIPIQMVKTGIELQLKQMSHKDSYSTFAKHMNTVIPALFEKLKNPHGFFLSSQEIPIEEIGVASIAYAYGMKLLGNYIVTQKGIHNIGE
ncbi:DUF1836 domain-containing protein [Peptoniphilus sp. KCTC 25270]|uniref:DUF1836 domain-containing protein n=1 Tax=Peptoniphilus sp. KCTC 25270 TaxID=2897414 RepID=UPI001E5F0252|nr:DUF1836 domain-containing protein [Peptoniphilus sp. KCTC 25270]MCD1147752.1 DUF1836 domain-containing protein [Peptoniphilus sp. KCTC 25270]